MTIRFERRRFIVAAAAVVPVTALAQTRGQPDEGIDYQLVKPPQPVDSGAKVEVLEFFQYSCPHCYSFNPDLEAWRKRQGAAINYVRLPINWNNSTVNHTKTYYTLEAMGLVDSLHDKFFAAIQVQKRRMTDADEIADFMAANGVDRAKWLSNFNSFTVNAKVARAGQVWRAYKIDGTPAVGIDGKFLTSPAQAGGRQNALAVMDFLVERTRSERGGKK